MTSAEGTKSAHRFFPFGTALLVVALLGMEIFTRVTGNQNWITGWLLQYGAGLKPWQWFSSVVIFSNLNQAVVHLLFIGFFGVVAEKRLGWENLLKMVAICGVIVAAAEQTYFLQPPPAKPHFASTATHLTYILAGAAIILGPTRTLGSLLPAFETTGMLGDFWILQLGMVFFGGDLLQYLMQENYSSSLYFHGVALLLGLGLSAFMVSAKIVDCEGEDLFSSLGTAFAPMEYTPSNPNERYSEVLGPKKKKKKSKQTGLNLREDPPELLQPAEKSPAKSIQQFKDSLEKGEGGIALAALHKIRRMTAEWSPEQGELLQLTGLLIKAEEWEEAVLLLREGIEKFPDAAASLRLQLAQIELDQQHRPRQCQRTLSGIPAGTLLARDEQVRTDLHKRAQELIDEGHIELGGDNWGGNLT